MEEPTQKPDPQTGEVKSVPKVVPEKGKKTTAKAKVVQAEPEKKLELFSAEWWEVANAILSAPFPEESYQDNTARTGNSEVGIKPQYIIERLNDAFGAQHWIANELDREAGQNFVRMRVELLVGYYKEWNDKETGEPKSTWVTVAKRDSHGGMRIIKGNLPDSLKGAKTDALKKAASEFNVAGEAYKGAITMAKAWTAESKQAAKAEGLDPNIVKPQANQKAPVCPQCGERMMWRVSQRGPFWGCSMYPNCKGLVAVSDVDVNGNIVKKNAVIEKEEIIDYTNR